MKLLEGSPQALDEEKRILIKKGPVSAKTSLREIETHYKSRPEWKVLEEGGVLSIPVEEFRMVKPSPKWTEAVRKTKRQGLLEKVGNIFSRAPNMREIDRYPVGLTSDNLMEQSLGTYQESKEDAKKAGKSNNEAEKIAGKLASKEPHFQVVKGW